MRAEPAMPLYEGQKMADLHEAATHNGVNLTICLKSQDAAIEYLDKTGQ
ncbi:hypothetical protein GCM10027347_59180 [Larkinella harenae]